MRINKQNASLRTWQQLKAMANENRQKEAISLQATGERGNVVGGSLDGERFPEGTRDGQSYRWNANARRWVVS